MFDNFAEWLKNPAREMSAFNWFLLVGLVMLSVWAWSTIIRKIAE